MEEKKKKNLSGAMGVLKISSCVVCITKILWLYMLFIIKEKREIVWVI